VRSLLVFEICDSEALTCQFAFVMLGNCELDPLDAIVSTQLPGNFHKDPADRIIVAIAYRRNIELMTCDQKILNYPHVKTLW
jgi:PIN domain nuclease of toxin-antitoxin system